MKPNSNPGSVRVLRSTVGVAALTSVLLGASAKDWSFDVVPYLWVADIGVETGVSSTPSGPERFATRLSAGAMLTAQARYRSFGAFVDLAWARLETEALDPGPAYSAVQLRSDFLHTTAAITYQLPLTGKWRAEVLAGARLWYVNEDFDLTGGVLPGFSTSGEKTWVDPVVGVSVNYELSERWSLGVKGILGGFGAASELTGEAFAGVSYRFASWGSASVGYRYLHEEYTRDSFAFNLDAHGFLLGFGFHF